MNNQWLNKCSSTWQSTTMPSVASSSQLQPPMSRSQLEMNTSQCFYPHTAQDLRPSSHGSTSETAFFNTLNFGSYKSDGTELGNSFLSILSGSPSLLQRDFQQFSNPKSFSTSSINSGSFMINAAGNEVPLPSTGLICKNQVNHKRMTGADLGPVVSSTAVLSNNCSSSIILHNNLQDACFNLQNSDLARAVIHHIDSGNEKVKDVSFVRGKWHSGVNSVVSGKLHLATSEASQKMPIERKSFTSDQSPAFLSGCPRVFCLSKSGDLLLSNTGLLGVVCSCHCLHMSIFKFCEHAGLYNVNPGHAVHIDSGETIAQWRKLYFQKFGIRVPEDQSGWDWPESFSATAGLVKSSPTTPSTFKKSDFSHLVGSSRGSLKCGQPRDNNLFSESSVTAQNPLNEGLHDKQRNCQDSCNFVFKGFTRTSESSLHAVADNPMPRRPTMSNFGSGGSDSGSQPVSAYVDSVSKIGYSFISQPIFQNLRTLGSDSNVQKSSSLQEAGIVDRDAILSNIELKLGQPYQQSWTLGNTMLPIIGPKPLVTLGDSQTSVSQDHLIRNKDNFWVADKCRRYPQCASSTSHFETSEQNQSNFINCTFGANTAVDKAKLEQFRGDSTKSLLHSDNTSGKFLPRVTSNIANGNEHSICRTLQCESHAAKFCPTNFPWNSGDGLQRHLNIEGSGLLRGCMEGKGVWCATGSSYIGAESDYGHYKRHDNSRLFNGFVVGTNNPSSAGVIDKNLCTSQLSGKLSDISNAINFFNYSGKVASPGSTGLINNASLRLSSSAMGSGNIALQKLPSACFSSATSTSIPNLTSALPNKESVGIGPYLVDEKMRQQAARHVLELSKQENAISSSGINQEHGRFGSLSHLKIPVVDRMCSERRHDLHLTNRQHVPEVVLKPPQFSALHRMGVDADKLAPVAGLSNWCNLSTSVQGNSLRSKDVDMLFQSSHDHISDENSRLRLGRTESIIPLNEHANGCLRVPNLCLQENYSCAVHTQSSGGYCDSKIETSVNAFKEQIDAVGCTASNLVASKVDRDYTVVKEKNLSLDKRVNGHMSKKIDCPAFQWKDVPQKVVGVCNVTRTGKPSSALDGSGNDNDQFEDAADECSKRTGKDMSSISSGCSTPVVTQASIEVNNTDSCTVDAGDTRYVNDLVVDEGSAIDKCWSSDDAVEIERCAEILGSTGKSNSIKKRSSIANQSSRSLIDELKLLDSLQWKKLENRVPTEPAAYNKTNPSQKAEGASEGVKRKKEIKRKMPDASFPAPGTPLIYQSFKHISGVKSKGHSNACKDKQMLLLSHGASHPVDAASFGPDRKRRKSSLSSVKTISRKRDLGRVYNNNAEKEDDSETDRTEFLQVPDVSNGKRIRQDWHSDPSKHQLLQEPDFRESKATAKSNSAESSEAVCWKMNKVNKKARPVVCGKYGIISDINTALDTSKPAKIVSLRKIYEDTRRSKLSKSSALKSTSTRELQRKRSRGSNNFFDEFAGLKEKEIENHCAATSGDEMDPDNWLEATEKICLNGDTGHSNEFYSSEKEEDAKSMKDRSISESYRAAGLKTKSKEARKRSLFELIVTGNKSKCEAQKKCGSLGKFLKSSGNSNFQNGEPCDASTKKPVSKHRCEPCILEDTFCSVCGSSNKDEINCLLECSHCLIRVHQACYGVVKVPKGRWSCRPCRTSSKNIACVLCGYGGGAMTRALRSHNIAKSLLKAWNIETECSTNNRLPSLEALSNKMSSFLNSLKSEKSDLFPVIRPVNIEASSTAVWKMDLQKQSEILMNFSKSPNKLENSITMGVLDPTLKQWVHMVCGLWTPGTRCPNVDTMSAFDVSGASCPRTSVVCSICNRPGGSCIRCRVVSCSVQFHPWCAHQKGLLQSEVEGVDNESVGFYGRCVHHATGPTSEYDRELIDTEHVSQEEKKFTCARTEGYKGRKREGLQYNIYCQSNGNTGCLVPQEQLNAWLHINGLKSCTKGLPKILVSDIEHDCRKEYARYRQVKGWKHLVVYKSGIHALGLYTSRFISRGAMVVEYVGEIVGLRVADRRESEYQSGRKLQYESACYFFRIDKEHIIDATRKGGIARFVNHSCLPNCVAKVISVRNEKKVVFFAERDIYPGEEITYDYNFNHEDEGKKIPCFCNSKNCRRYLN